MTLLKQSTARNLLLKLYLSTDHVSPATGKTLTVTISKDGAAFAAIAGTVTELSSGWYKVALTAADTATLGEMALRATASGCDDAERLLNVVAFDPQDSAALGLSRVDAAIASRMATFTYTAPDSASTIATAVWAAGTRSLTTFGTLVADIWANTTRTLSAFGFDVTVSANNDKTGYALTATPPTAAEIRQEIDANSTKLDLSVGSRMATFAYTAPPSANDNADALLKRDWSAITGEAPRSVVNALRAIRNKVTRGASTLTVMKEDDSTEAWSAAIVTSNSAKPITEVDPS